MHRGKLAYAEVLLNSKTTKDRAQILGEPGIPFLKEEQEALFRPLFELITSLRAANVADVHVVFDGGALPAKRRTEEAREEARWRASSEFARQKQRGHADVTSLSKLLSSAVEISAEMVGMCMLRLKELEVKCMVAPCEADAQLALLADISFVDVCISEDVDLLAFGCPRVLFGLDRRGTGREIRSTDLERSRLLHPLRLSKETLIELSVLAGCDYLPSLTRLGLKTAAQLLHRSNYNLKRALHLAQRAGLTVPQDKPQPLRPIKADELLHNALSVQNLLGLTLYDHQMARHICEGSVNPFTLKTFEFVGDKPDFRLDEAISPLVSSLDCNLKDEASQNTDLTAVAMQTTATAATAVALDGAYASPSATRGFRRPRSASAIESRGSSDDVDATPNSCPPKRRQLGCRITLMST